MLCAAVINLSRIGFNLKAIFQAVELPPRARRKGEGDGEAERSRLGSEVGKGGEGQGGWHRPGAEAKCGGN